MHGKQARCPEISLKFPIFQVFGGKLYGTSGLLFLGSGLSGSQNQQVFLFFLIPDHEGIPPVIRVITLLRCKSQLVLGLGPVQQIIALRMHQHLGCLAQLWIVPVESGIKNMILSLCFKNASCKNKLILLLVGSPRERCPFILIVHKIRSHRQIPAKGFAKRAGFSGISLVKQIKLISFSKRHAVAEPGVWKLIV